METKSIEIIEYIRKNNNKKTRKTANRTKRGVMFCSIHPEDPKSVIVGFSMCSKFDEFDHIDGEYCPGFGLDIAANRAEKWSNHTDYFVQNSFTNDMIENIGIDLCMIINKDKSSIVEIPPSMVKHLKGFVGRCRRYYKDKDFPEWVRKFENNEEIDTSDFEMNIA